jgi:hypothetical protein
MSKFKIYIATDVALSKYHNSLMLVSFLNQSSESFNTGSVFVDGKRYLWSDNRSDANEITIPFLKQVMLDGGWIEEYPFFIELKDFQLNSTVPEYLKNNTIETDWITNEDGTQTPIAFKQLTWKEYYERNNNTIFKDILTDLYYIHSNPFGVMYDKNETKALFFDEDYKVISVAQYLEIINTQPKPEDHLIE